MDETATKELTDEDIRTVMPGTSTAEGRDRSRPDGRRRDGR